MTQKPQRKSTDEKVEIAKQIANQGKKVVKTYASIENSILRIIRWMSTWIDRLLFNQKFGKPVSLILAVLLYVTVNFGGGDNIFDSGVRGFGEPINNIPLTVLANNEVYEITGLPETVNVMIVGEMADIQMTKNQGGYKVVADLTGFAEGVHQVNLVPVDFSPRVQVATTPSTAVVTIRRKISQQFILDYDFVNMNKMDLEFVLEKPQLALSEIIVRAAKSTIDQIAFVKALIDVSGVTEAFTKEAVIVAYDQNGNRLAVDIIPSVVQVTVNVSSPQKIVPVIVDPQGEIPNGMAIQSIRMDHQSVTLFGPLAVLDNIDVLRIPINATTLTGNTSLVYTITLPSGVQKSSVTKVNMDIELAPGVKRILPSVEIFWRNNPGFRFTLSNSEDAYTDVELFGTQEAVDAISAEDIVVYIDMTGIQLGLQETAVYVDGGTTLVRFTPEKKTIEIEVVR